MHVYDRVQEYENDEIDNSSNSTSDKSVSNGKNSSLYKMCIYLCLPQSYTYPDFPSTLHTDLTFWHIMDSIVTALKY